MIGGEGGLGREGRERGFKNRSLGNYPDSSGHIRRDISLAMDGQRFIRSWTVTDFSGHGRSQISPFIDGQSFLQSWTVIDFSSHGRSEILPVMGGQKFF